MSDPQEDRELPLGNGQDANDAHDDTEPLDTLDLADDNALDIHDMPTLPFSFETGEMDAVTITAQENIPTVIEGQSSTNMPYDSDPNRTLPGSGGLDPNPDFDNLSQKTVARMKPVPPQPPQPPQQPRQPQQPNQGRSAAQPPQPVPPRPSAPQQPPSPRPAPPAQPFQHTLVHIPGETRNYPPPSNQTVPNRPPSPNQQPTIPNQPGRYPAPNQQPTVPNPNYQGGYPPSPPPGYQQGRPYPPNPNRAAPRPKKRRLLGCTPGCLMVGVGVLLAFCGGVTLLTLILTATLGAQLEERYSDQIARVDTYDNFESIFYYDRNGTQLYESFGEGRRVNVPFENFPQDLLNATIAIEDDTFWTNPGFEVQATLRAFLQYVGVSEGSTGGSTITQQLVRNVLFEPEYRAERSVQRKFEEILLAFLLRQRKSPQEVLALYLNEIYYGNLAYGAEAAAQTFFDKSVQDLTLPEAALLAGLPQAPANLDPFNPDPAVQEEVRLRWLTVLDRMVTERFLTDAQRNDAVAQGYTLVPPEAPLRAPHFTVYAQGELQTLMAEIGYPEAQLAQGGLQVYTTVDLRVQDMAQEIARQQVAALAGNNVSNASVVVLQPVTGEILAMVGSIDYNNEAIDGNVNVTTAPRQPGSTMKPFTYSAALELGMTPADIIWDTPTEIADYVPENYDRTFHGPVRMRTALSNSYNIPAVQTLRRIGVENLLAMMRRVGVESLSDDPGQYGLSLTLGGGEVTLLELTRGYSVFANGGAFVDSSPILCVLDNNNRIIYQYTNSCPRGEETATTVYDEGYGTQVLDPRVAFLMGDILGDEAARQPAMGYRSALYTGDILSAVKTGTTNDYRDNWTVGYTRNVAVGVWVGNSDGAPMYNVSGLAGAAPIWNGVISGIYNDDGLLGEFARDGVLLPDRLEPPGGISIQQLCAIPGLRDPATNCSQFTNEWMLDTPAGVPDGVGGMVYPDQTPYPNNQQPASGVWLRQVEPSLYQVLVHPIPPNVGQGIVVSTSPGQPNYPPPLYCQLPMELAGSDPAARDQLFIAPPADPADAARAEQYARNQGFAFLPTIACSPELINAAGSPAIVTAYISNPSNGQTMNGPFDIVGTAQFGAGQAQYYRVDICGGQFGGCATIGDIHRDSVVNGRLEGLPALSPGEYQLQLIVVGNDGNFVQPPYTVSFNVTG